MRKLVAVLSGFTFLFIVALIARTVYAAPHDLDRANDAYETKNSANTYVFQKSITPDLGLANDAYDIGDYATAYIHYKALAEQGNTIAQFNLGIMYKKGRGVPKDYTKAVGWFRKAADQGDAVAQYQLGKMYLSGHGVPQNYVEAFKWIQGSAELGYTKAQYHTGIMYKSGQGVAENKVLAYMWFSVAVSRSYCPENRKATIARRTVAEKMNPAEIAEAQRLAQEWKPKKEK
jgi:TPR repeat protein